MIYHIELDLETTVGVFNVSQMTDAELEHWPQVSDLLDELMIVTTLGSDIKTTKYTTFVKANSEAQAKIKLMRLIHEDSGEVFGLHN